MQTYTPNIEPLESRILLAATFLTAPFPATELYVNQNGDINLLGNYISAVGEHDTWQIYFDSNGNGTFSTEGSTDTEMALYIGDGPPDFTDDDSGAGTNAQISAFVSAGFLYYLDVVGYNNTVTGFYDLHVNGPFSSITPISINLTTLTGSASGNIGHEFDFDFYTFIPQTTGLWSVFVDPVTDWDATYNVYDSLGNPVSGSFTHSINIGSEGYTEAWTTVLAAGQSYYLRVDGFGSSTGDYDIDIVGPSGDGDNNDQIVEAFILGDIDPDASITTPGTIDSDIDVDMVAFNATAGQTIGFDIDTADGSSLDSFIRLFDIGGNELAFNNNGSGPPPETGSFDSYMKYTFDTASTYYLGVSSFTNGTYNPVTGGDDVPGSTGAYDLIISDIKVVDDSNEPNNSLADASDPLGNAGDWEGMWLSSISGLGNQNDDDWYLVNVAVGQEHLSIEMQYAYLQGDINLALYDPSETQLANSATASNIETIDYKVPAAGEYYVKVYSGNQGNVYDLRFDTFVPYHGDANLDRIVDLLDLVTLGEHYNQPGTWAEGDFDENGVVDLLDLVTLGENYNTQAPVESSEISTPKADSTALTAWLSLEIQPSTNGQQANIMTTSSPLLNLIEGEDENSPVSLL